MKIISSSKAFMKVILSMLFAASFAFCLDEWNAWTDAASVKNKLMEAQDSGVFYFSQSDLYRARRKTDYNSSKFKEKTDEVLYVYGLDFGYASGTFLEEGYKNRNRQHVIEIVKTQWAQNKAIPLFSWHLENPYIPSDYEKQGCTYRFHKKVPDYPTEHRFVINEILNGTGSECGYGRKNKNDDFSSSFINPQSWFDKRCQEVAAIINELVDESNKPIPFIFRLWHEMEADWMWWGSGSVSPEDYKAFFILTRQKILEYAPNAQILWGYGPDSYWDSEEEFMLRYPGDEYVDIIGYDDYKIARPDKKERELKLAQTVSEVAKKHKKIAALFETANKREKTKDNFFKDFLYPITQDSLVHFGLVQLWASGIFEEEQQVQDRLWFLRQSNVLKIYVKQE